LALERQPDFFEAQIRPQAYHPWSACHFTGKTTLAPALKDHATAVCAILDDFEGPTTVEEVAAGFKGRRTEKRLDEVAEILEMLVALGQIGADRVKYWVA
jgi:hypothetical protein